MSNKAAGKKSPGRNTAGPLTMADRPERIRNLALVGHSGSGKTTLAEALLAAVGEIPRAGTVPEGSTVSDHDPIEVHQQRSIALSVCPLHTDGVVVNLLDTPGYPDFTGELRAGLRAADGVLFVVAAGEDIDPITVSLWQECAALSIPRAVVITRLDTPNSSFATSLAACQHAFGGDDQQSVLPLYLVGPGCPPTAITGLLSIDRYDYADGPPATRSAGDSSEVEEPRAQLIEAIINNSEDESLLDRYLGGEQIDIDVLVDDLETSVAAATFFPVVPVCAATGLGLEQLLELISGGFPSPTEVSVPTATDLDGSTTTELSCDPDGPLVAEVVRTTIDPYLGRLSIVRVFSGTLTPETTIHVAGHGGEERGHPDHDTDERVASLFSPLGATLRPVTRVVAGDICAIGRLATAETGDTVSDKSEPLLVEPWDLPQPLLPVAVEAATRADEDALAKGLARLTAGDPTVRVDRNAGTGQLVLWCLGEAHADVVLERLRATGAQVETVDLRIALQETFTRHTSGHGRQVKQSGGHGQYAVCDIEVTPLERGAGVQFAERVVGGAVPHQFIGSVEKGVRAQLAAGLNNDHVPVVDVLVTLVDGKAHSVDSSDAAFQTAGSLAIKDAAANGPTVLLEPVARVEVIVPDAHVGAVMGDLSTRRAKVTGTQPDQSTPGLERTVIHAEVPEQELVRYPLTLRSLTAGTGRFIREFAHYEGLPEHLHAQRG